MSYDAFLNIDTVPGESTDDKHKNWIEVMSYHWGVSQPNAGDRSTGGAASVGRVTPTDLSIVHVLDKASPKLFLSCCKGEHIPKVVLELCRATGDKQKYMSYTLTDVMISGVRPGGSSNGQESLPLEEVSFNWGKIELDYTLTDHKTGKPQGDVKANWSVTENKGA